jgi:branched-chain amino acid transport system permease protein
MLAYPLAILYVFEWLGLQEVTLPIKRDNPIAYMQFADHRLYTLLALAMMLGTILLTRAVERSRFGMALLAIKQNEGRRGSRGDQHAGLEAPGRHAQRRHRRSGWRILRGRAAGGDPAIRIRHAGVGPGADGRHVRRRRNGLGAGDRIGDPDPVGRNAQRRSGLALSRHSGGDYGLAIICVILLAPEGLFWKIRDFMRKRSAAPVAATPGKSDITTCRRRRTRATAAQAVRRDRRCRPRSA